MATYDEAIGKAREIGREHGENAASWVTDGNTSEETYAALLRGIEDGDPMVLDMLPAPDLSGEWADGYTPDRLSADVGWLPEPGTHDHYDWLGELCAAYEEAFTEAAEEAVIAACQAQVNQ